MREREGGRKRGRESSILLWCVLNCIDNAVSNTVAKFYDAPYGNLTGASWNVPHGMYCRFFCVCSTGRRISRILMKPGRAMWSNKELNPIVFQGNRCTWISSEEGVRKKAFCVFERVVTKFDMMRFLFNLRCALATWTFSSTSIPYRV
jgi:hypothetical protein